MLAQQLDRTLGERVAVVAPAIPTDVSVNVLGVEADGVEDTNCFWQNLVANAVTRHAHDCVLRHDYFLLMISSICCAHDVHQRELSTDEGGGGPDVLDALDLREVLADLGVGIKFVDERALAGDLE